MNWYADKASRQVDTAAPEGLELAAEKLLAESRQRVPVATGELKDSGKVVMQDGAASVVYDAPHALSVHERLDVRHPDGQAKYLEEPMNQFGDKLLQTLARVLDKALR
jgi:hypothetical protein